MHLKPHKVGLALGGFIAAMHIIWSVIVALGWGQPLLEFAFWAHMVKPALFKVGPFDFGTTLILIICVAAIGYGAGRVFATIWNKVQK
jgi:hypothetical protein